MSAQETLARGIESCRGLMERYLRGFDDGSLTAQRDDLPNHLGWNLGHCALTMHRVAEMLDSESIPASDFVDGDRGDESHFGKESVAFGSSPMDDPSMYPTLDRCAEIYSVACERLAAAIRVATDDDLARMVEWGGARQGISLYDLVLRMIFHNGIHAGQVVDLRRGLGLGSIFA